MVRAVLIGLAVFLGGTVMSGLYAGALASLVPAVLGLATHTQMHTWSGPTADAFDAVLNIVVEAAFSMLGGFVAGSLYRREPVRVGLCLAVAGAVFGYAFARLVPSPVHHGVAYTVLEYLACFTATVLGSALLRRREAVAA